MDLARIDDPRYTPSGPSQEDRHGRRDVAPVLVLLVALVGCGDTVVDTPQTTTAPTTDTTAVDDTTVETTPPTPEAEGVVAGFDFGALDLPSGEPYDGHTELVDDTGTIQVEVSTAWSDTDTAPSGEDEWPYVLASADIDAAIRVIETFSSTGE